MKVTTKNVGLINQRLEYLYDNFGIDPLDTNVEIGDKKIVIDFPRDDSLSYSIADFLRYTDNLENIKVIGNHSVISGRTRQTIINIEDYACYFSMPQIMFEVDNISLKIVENPFLIGIIASRDGIYDKYTGVSPCSIYTAIELQYTNADPDEEKDIELIKRCLFYIGSKYNVPISIGEFFSIDESLYEENEEEKADLIIHQNELIPYCRAMDYYMEGLYIGKMDIKYLHLYKIIEYFSPIVSKKASYEQLNKRLDALQVVERDSEYLESIFKLTKQYEVSLKDKELANTVLNECVDIALLFQFLPDKIQKTLSKSCHFEVKNIASLSSSTIEVIKKEIADILYATRNSIVHAKSNYTVTGKECSEEDLEQLNEFMVKLCECLFVWNGRQSKEFQLK